MINKNISDITSALNLTLLGDQNLEIKGFSPYDELKSNHISFSSSKVKSTFDINFPTDSVLIIDSKTPKALYENIKSNFIISDAPQSTFIDIINHCLPQKTYPKLISDKSEISKSVSIDSDTSVLPFSYIADNVKIGKNCIIHPFVCIYDNVSIGDNCIIHSGSHIREDTIINNNTVIHNGSVIGADGFGYIPDSKLGIKKVPQIGKVIIGENVEIGANSCVDRGAIGDTVLGNNNKLDNHVQIGHNVKSGQFCLFCGGVAIGGSSNIGNNVTFGGCSAVADHTNIPDNVRLAGMSALIGEIKEPGDYAGFPAVPVKHWRKMIVGLRKLPSLIKNIKS